MRQRRMEGLVDPQVAVALPARNEPAQSDLYMVAADGRSLDQLTDDPAFDTAPQWSPDGATILYGSRPADTGE